MEYVFTIKGLYLNFERKNPTYYGSLKGCINYVNNNQHDFLHFGEDIQICLGDEVLATQKCITQYDEIGEYCIFEDWK